MTRRSFGLEIPLCSCCCARSWLGIESLERSHCGILVAKEMSGYTGIDQSAGDSDSLVEVFEACIEAGQTAGKRFLAFSRRMTLEL